MKPFARRSVVFGVAWLWCCVALAQQVRFVSPQPGTVRGVVELKATKPNPGDGWISYKISPAGKEGDYVTAVINPFTYAWDTRKRDATGARIYPDGDYVLVASAFDPSGNPVGESSITVSVRNEVSPSEVRTPVLLRAAYSKGQKLDYTAEGKLTVYLPEQQRKTLPISLRLEALVKAAWSETVLAPTAEDAPAVLDKVLKSGYIQVIGSDGVKLRDLMSRVRLSVFPDAEIKLYNPKDEHFPLGEYYVKLPIRPVNVGDTWQSELSVLPLPNAVSRVVLQAQNKLDGFEWVAGRKCARILSTFKQDEQFVMVKVGDQTFPLKTSYEARRISYFGLDEKRFISFEEQTKHVIEVPAQAVQILYQFQIGSTAAAMKAAGAGGMGGQGMGPGMGGMGAMGGMPMGGMGGGMPMPGMGPGGMGGMGPGGMPMGGMGPMGIGGGMPAPAAGMGPGAPMGGMGPGMMGGMGPMGAMGAGGAGGAMGQAMPMPGMGPGGMGGMGPMGGAAGGGMPMGGMGGGMPMPAMGPGMGGMGAMGGVPPGGMPMGAPGMGGGMMGGPGMGMGGMGMGPGAGGMAGQQMVTVKLAIDGELTIVETTPPPRPPQYRASVR